LFAGGVAGWAGGCADPADGADWFAPAAFPVTVLVAESTTVPAALVTAEAVPVRESPEAEDFADPDVGPVSAETVDVTPEPVPGRSSLVAA